MSSTWRGLALPLAGGLLLLPRLLPAQAPAAPVRGEVIARADGRPVVAAEVTRAGHPGATRTDAAGRFSLVAAPGDTLLVRAIGFRPVRQLVTEAPLLRVQLEGVAVTLPELVTTAGQRTVRADETTASVTTVTRAEIDAAAASGVNQVLRQLPGVQELPSPPARTTLSIRGLSDARVLLLIDGEPVAGAALDLRDIGRLSTLAVERIEVTKGPSGVEFGSDALGGVVNLVTAPPARRLLLEASGRAGGLGRAETALGISGTRGTLGVRVSGGLREMDVVTGVDAGGSTFDRVLDLRTDLRWTPRPGLRLRADVQGTAERQRWPVGGEINGFIDNRTVQGLLEGETTTLGGLTRARVFLQRHAYQFRQARGPLPIAGTGDALEQREALARVLLSQTRVAGAHTLDGGLQLTTRRIDAPGRIRADSASDDVLEAFLRDAVAAGPVLVTAGARLTASRLWGTVLAPSVGTAWRPAPAWRVQANVARGFRAPGFKEIRYTFTNAAAGYLIAGNAALRPESSWSATAGVQWQAAPALAVELEGYRTTLRDLIDTRFQGLDPSGLQVFSNVNVARARTEGMELQVRWQVAGTDVTAGYDLLRARDLDSGLPLGRRAAHTARVRLARRWAVLDGLQLDAGLRVTGAAPLVGSDLNGTAVLAGTQAAFPAVDLQARLGLRRGAELAAGVNNLLGRVPAGWTPAFARQVFVGLTLRQGGDG